MIRLLALVIVMSPVFATRASAQTAAQPQILLENEFVRVTRVSSAAADDKLDQVLVQLSEGKASFIPKGTTAQPAAPTNADDLVVELKKHWDAEVQPCSFPRQCTRETKMGNETVAWSTTLFTNGFVTGTTHRLALHATLDSSYYTAKGSDRILFIPFTAFHGNFGGIDEILRPGEPYFTKGVEVEVTAPDAETRWLVLRLNVPQP